MKIKNQILFLFLTILVAHSILRADEQYFVENKSQWDNQVFFFANTPAYNIWVTDGTIYFDSFEFINKETENSEIEKYFRKGQLIGLDFINTDFSNFIIKHQTNTYFNYFSGKQEDWKTNVRSMKMITFNDIYPGIDLILYFEGIHLRFDFIINSDGSPDDIEIEILGSETIENETKSELRIPLENGNILIKDMFAYQENSENKNSILCNFLVSGNTFKFQVDDYDKSKILVIDPLVFSTFLGGDNYDYGEDIKVDSKNNIYTCGYSYSSEYPTTVGAYSDEMSGEQGAFPDIVISKFDSSGDSLIFSTYIGGRIDDYGKSIALDTSDNVYITGYCGPTSTFPTTSGAYDTTFNGGYDVFVIKLSSEGDSLLYSTFIGGTQDDYGQAIALDEFNNAYITGYTAFGGEFPVTPDVFDNTLSGGYDVFVSKISPDGTQLLYSTYIGGKDDDFGQDIVVDNEGKAYITGITRSSNYPFTSRAYDNTYNDTASSKNRGDCFISKLDETAIRLEYSSYFGGKHTDGAYSIAIDSAKNIYFAGISKSSDYPTTNNAYQKEYNGNEADTKGHGDIIITKISPLGDSLIYSTYIGGESTDRAFDLVLDKFNNAFITGSTASEHLPITDNAYDKTWNDSIASSDVFAMKLNVEGSDLLYSSYIGGRYKDVGNGLDHKNGMMYIIGITASDNYPTTENTFDTLYNGDNKYDIFVTKLYPFGMNFGDDFQKEVHICLGDSVQIGADMDGYGIISYKWNPGNTLSDPTVSMPFAYPQTTTTYTIKATDGNGISALDSVVVNVHPLPNATIFGPRYIMVDSKHVYFAIKNDETEYKWNLTGGTIISGLWTNIITIQWAEAGDYEISLNTKNENGCLDNDTLKVQVGNYFKPNIIVWGETEICEGDTVILDAGAGYTAYLWNDSTRTRYDTISTAGNFWVVVADEKGFIGISDTISITVYPRPTKPQIVFLNEMLRCYEIYPLYQWYKDDVAISGAIHRGYTPIETGTYYIIVSNEFGCTNISNSIFLDFSSVNNIHQDFHIKIIPNPNNGNFIIDIVSNNNSFIHLEIINILGQIVFAENNISEGLISVEIPQLDSGVYFVKVFSSRKIYIEKFVKY